MTQRAALVSGGSSGIGLEIARILGEEGYAVTISGRRLEKLEAAAEDLRGEGIEVEAVAANLVDEDEVIKMVSAHRERFGRLDVLVNNAGVAFGAPFEQIETKRLDMQIGINLRSCVIATREALPMLKQAGREHQKALIVNTSSITAKQGQALVSVYSATKAGVVGLSQALQREFASDRIQVTALCPAFVDTPMTEIVKGQVGAEEMLDPKDVAAAVRFLLQTSTACLVPEIVFQRFANLGELSP